MARYLRAAYRGLVYGLQLLIGLLLCLYLTFKLFERQHLIEVLPAQLEPASVLLIGGESGLREGCGAAVFRLSKQTRARVQQGGLTFLQMARQARGYTDDYHSFEPWQATPLPASYNDESGWLSLGCAGAGEDLQQRIYQAMQHPGAFYSSKREGMLLVIPAEGLLVFGYNG